MIAVILKSKPELDGQMQYTKDSLEGHTVPYIIEESLLTQPV